MPCNSDYLEPTNFEIELSKVYDLLQELRTGHLPDEYGSGFHPEVYNKHHPKKHLDDCVAKLCSQLQQVKDITKYSLELQMWWRDHQKADKKRIEKELKTYNDVKARKLALKKLTPYERKLLKLK
jgi:hypothetical protein